jgi:hypothetical protein
MPNWLNTKSTCNLIGKATLGCALSSKLEKTFIQPRNDSIITEVAPDPKNEAESKRVRSTSKDCQCTTKE